MVASARWCGALIVLLSLYIMVSFGQSLPDLRLDAYPAVSREPIAQALADARAHPDDAARVGELGMVLQAWEQWETATVVYTRAQSLDRRYDWYYLAGVANARLGRHAEAAALFGQAVALAPTSLPARLALADALFDSGAAEASEQQYRSLINEPAAEPHARYGLGRLLAARGDNEEALEEFNRAVALFPDFGAAWYAKGLALRNLNRLDEAKQGLVRAQQLGALWPGVEDPVLARVRALRDDPSAHLNRGVALDRQGDLAGAIREHEAAVAIDPMLVQAHVNLIALYGKQGDAARAEAHYREAVRLGSGVAEAHFNYGLLLMQQHRDAEAEAALRRAVELNPEHARAWNNLGQIAERSGKLAEGLTDYRHAVEQAPSDTGIRFNLARMLIATAQYKEAIPQFEALSATEGPARPRFVFGLATAWVLSGDIAKGRQYALEARALAAEQGQADLVAAIDRDLAKLPQQQ
jgi:tetratricopeptide (TPR) repeat protein